jgi:hypothetical protein
MKVYSPEFRADAVALYLSDASRTFEGLGAVPAPRTGLLTQHQPLEMSHLTTPSQASNSPSRVSGRASRHRRLSRQSPPV